ncbi:loricrin-like [Gymnogyps californianus]|uniref:loricrin-like n=1 Tax=Gymnogyps californianus TaxID=33616 RepID=UPI0021CA1DE7|nr:loricrin-like [Gymnogyps californianus]
MPGSTTSMATIYHILRGRCARRNRDHNNEISSHHRGRSNSSRDFSDLQGRGSFFCGGEGSVTYSRGASSSQPMPTSSTYSIAGGYRYSGDGSVVIANGDSGETSGWGIAGGTVPVYGTGGGIGCSSEDSGLNTFGSSGGGGGSSCHRWKLGITAGGGSGYGYDASPREKALTTGGGSGGSGYYSGGPGYGIRGCSGPELSSGGGVSPQAMQQKCPVVVPDIEAHQSKQTSHWLPSQTK